MYTFKKHLINFKKSLIYFLKNIKNFNKNVLEYLYITLEDDKRFYAFFKKAFPKSFKYLRVCKFAVFLLVLLTLKVDQQTYLEFSSSILEEESSIYASPRFYSPFSFSLYFFIIVYEFVLSVYVTLKANSPVNKFFFQIAKHGAKAAGSAVAGAVVWSFAPIEPNSVSNFVHTKTFLGRGYDYEIGSMSLKAKGDIITGALRIDDMRLAASKHGPASKILDAGDLQKIVCDPAFKDKICQNTTIGEKVLLGVPLLDMMASYASNPNPQAGPATAGPTNLNSNSASSNSQYTPTLSSNILDSNILEGDNSNTEKSTTPGNQKSPLRRHHSEPLPKKSDNSDTLRRRNTG